MRTFLSFILALICLSTPAMAQEDDRGFIVGFLEDTLSDAGREVQIEGFEGALSSQATLSRLTIADDKGIWLELEEAELDWTRSALLRGRLSIDLITAKALTLHRVPGGQSLSPAKTEARDFTLPDLPVSINIGRLALDTLTLAPPVLGEAARFTVKGSMSLDEGDGTTALSIKRIDKPANLSLDAGFQNATRQLAVDLNLSEAQGGVISRLIGLPGQPAIAFSLNGAAPLDDYTADLSLASDGTDRFSGTIGTTRTEDGTRRFDADLSGDLRPLFQPDLRPFFGPQTAVVLQASREAAGRVTLSNFTLRSAAMILRSEGRIAADGWPEKISLEGTVGSGTSPTRLPFTRAPTQIRSARITARYDRSKGESWQADIALDRLTSGPFAIEQTRATAQGTISRDAPSALTADITAAISGMRHQDAALDQAIGSQARASARLSWREGEPLGIEDLTAQAGDMTLGGAAQLGGDGKGLPLSADLRAEAASLARFSRLTGQQLTGTARLTLNGTAELLGGAFDGTLSADTEDLAIGNPMLDPFIARAGRLRLSALRDTNGIAIDRLDLTTPQATLRSSGQLNGRSGSFTLSANIRDLAQGNLSLPGPAQLNTALDWKKDRPLRLINLTAKAAQSSLHASGTIDPAKASLPMTGKARIDARDLSQLSRLARRPLRGTVNATVTGEGRVMDHVFNITTQGTAQGLRTGIAPLDALLAGGDTAFSGDVAKADGPIDLRRLTLDTPGLTLRAEGDGAGQPIDITGRLTNLARLAPGFTGPLNARGTVTPLDDWARRLAVNVTADGPGDTRAEIKGALRDYGQSVDLTASGSAPLGLANSFITPRAIEGTARYDLQINGTPRLAALSGNITTENARATLPNNGVVIEGISGRADLATGRAALAVTGRSRAGGRLGIEGPVSLTPPFQGDLSIALDSLRISDPDLYKTAATGRMSLTGPLATAPRLEGALSLNETRVRVPSGSGVSTQVPDGLKHVNDSRAARQTRARAGLGTQSENQPATSLSLDLLIMAPNRIFIRGRGLDAELGGRLRLRGSASDITPSGQFQLIRGRFDILGKRLTLTEGRVTLRGALDPYLRFVAETDAEEITAKIVMEGLASAPEVRFTSSPELPQEEVIARLIFGRGLDKISGFQAAQLASAIATLRGGGPGILGTFRSELGLDDLDVTTTQDGTTEVSAGRYISDNVYSEITADGEGRQQIELNLDVSRHVTVRGRANNDGNTGIGIFFEKDY
jgi:translocation and assembly module TamB